MSDTILDTPAGEHWKRIGVKPHHGVVTPLFSLRTHESGGIGTYRDIHLLADWCALIGMDIIQLLPLNDTGPERSPYSALSAFALNPIHLSLKHIPFFENIEKDEECKNILFNLDQLNHLQRVDYNAVRSPKEQFLKKYVDLYQKEIVKLSDFQQFRSENQWLESYALFKTLKEKRQWHSWAFWEYEVRHPSQEMLTTLLNHHSSSVEYHIIVQYLCFKQLIEAKRYANQKGIFLKGDIPILISRESADVWIHRELFRIEMSAGAPPDRYAINGQNWGFPIYRWNVMQQQNDRWWRERLAVVTPLYDLYRIDHVVGFYRLWAIPPNLTGREGEYIPSDPHEQLRLGEHNMRMMLDATPLLPIGEDLGVVPPEVKANLKKLGICGTKVMRWERMWEEDRCFIKMEDYVRESMTTVSTHDSETLQIWWSTHFDEVRDYCAFKGWNFTYELPRERHFEILKDAHRTSSLFHINLLQEYLALIPELSWHDIRDERINIPGKINDTNWTYRYKPTLEELCQNTRLIQLMKDIVS